MHLECVPFSRIPHTTPLFLDYLHDFSRTTPFFVRPPLQTEWLVEEARSIAFPPERRARVAAVLERQNRVFGASTKTLANIERLRAGASAAVTGQQVGLFGGPLFSLLKALSAIRIAEESSHSANWAVKGPISWPKRISPTGVSSAAETAACKVCSTPSSPRTTN